jgi:hypothetical protein
MCCQRMWSRGVLFIACCIGSGLGVVAQAQSVSETPRSELPPEIQQKMARIKGLTMLLEQNEEKVDRTKQVIAELERSIDLLGQRLQDDNVSEISYSEILMQLQVQRINLSIEKAGLDAKSEKLLQMVRDSATDTSNEKSAEKRNKLKELLELEHVNLERALALEKQGVQTAHGISEARKRVIEVELKLLEVAGPQRQTSPEAVWAAELLSKIALDQIEVNAKLAKVAELLTPLQHLRPQLSAMQSTKKELDAWHDELSKLKARQMELQNTLSEMQGFPNQPTP